MCSSETLGDVYRYEQRHVWSDERAGVTNQCDRMPKQYRKDLDPIMLGLNTAHSTFLARGYSGQPAHLLPLGLIFQGSRTALESVALNPEFPNPARQDLQDLNLIDRCRDAVQSFTR